MIPSSTVRGQAKAILGRALQQLEESMDGPGGVQRLPELTHAQARALDFVVKAYRATQQELDGPAASLPDKPAAQKLPELQDAPRNDLRALARLLKEPSLT